MPWLNNNQLPWSITVRKKLGTLAQQPTNPWMGIYQQRIKRKGFWTKDWQPRGRKANFKMKFYTPFNPQTVPQQANRSKFAIAISNWQGFTNEQRLVYNRRSKRLRMSGYNLYIKEYMNG